MIRLQLLGRIDLQDEDGRELRAVLAQPKRLALLACLAAASPAGPQRRDTLLGMFWPELDEEHARNALSQTVHFLRRWLGEGAIIARSADELALGGAVVYSDVKAFGAALAESRLEDALELYRGDMMPSFFVPEAAGFEEWLERERARLRSQAAAAARLLAERQEAGRHLTLAVTSARRAVELCNGDERPLRRLVELLDRLGDRAGALRAYEEFARKLAAELQVEPAPETVALIQRIRAAPLSPPPAIIDASSVAEGSGPPITRLAKAVDHRYKIERQLGAGAMAVVALAHDLRHHRRVAIKILRPELSSLMGPERFLQEIDIAASLMHPHILPLHDSGEVDGLLYYVMPYVEGESLRGRLERERRLPLGDALQIAREVADALAYAHHRGFVHRDIKPENILLSGGHALVADFGIARAIGSAGGERLATRGLGTGTPAYMSPEQMSGESAVDERTDIYALGCVLYEMLGGKPPFTGPTPEDVVAQRLREPLPRISRLREDVSPALDAAVAKALERAPGERFARASDFASALTLMPSSVTESRAPRHWRRAPAVLVVVAMLAVGGFAAWRQVQGRGGPVTNPHLVAVLPFRVAGADSSLRYLRHGMIDLLVAKLSGEGGPRAADARSVLAAFRSVADTATLDLPDRAALRVAERVGAGLVLQGSVAGPPQHMVLTASLLDAAGGVPKHATVEGSKDSLFVLVDKLTAKLLALDAGVNPLQLSSLTTTSLDALKAYLDGQAAYRRAAFAKATQSLDRAIEIDSTFALAASVLIDAQNWTAYNRAERPGHLAWRYRHRLSERDQLVLSVRLGARYPLWSPSNLDIAAAERLTQAVPESPEAWHALGDVLFHSGVLAGLSDARHRARLVLERALELDSLYAPALTHLISLAAEREDAGEVIRLVPRLLALDSTDWTAFAARWHLAVAQRDKRAMTAFIERLRSVSGGMTVNLSRGELGDSTGLSHRDAFLAVAQERLATPSERARHAWVSWMHALNLGRPTEARAWLAYTDSARQRNYRILGWVVGGDTLDLDAAGRREKARSATPAGEKGWPNAPFLMEAWKLFHNDLSSVDRTIQRFRSDAALRDTIRENHLVGAQLLEAWAAAIRNSPQAHRLLDGADSMLVGRGDLVSVELLDPLVAHLYNRLGFTDRALATVRRRLYGETFLHPAGLAETSRLEGLWAAQNGDRSGAISAYRRYLMLRTDPEPSVIPQRDSVRAELARVEERPTR